MDETKEWEVRIGRDGEVRFKPGDIGAFLADWLGWEQRQASQPSPEKLLTPGQFGKAVGVSRTTVYELIAKGLPAPIVPNAGRRIDLQQGRAWLVASGMKASGKVRKEARRAGR
jgi:hypothetical protein